MKISYNGLWKILIDKNMSKKDLAKVCELSPATVFKIGRGEFGSMDIQEQNGDDENIRAITKIENALNKKKYGLVQEEHSEKADEALVHNIPNFLQKVRKEKSQQAKMNPIIFYLKEMIFEMIFFFEAAGENT